MNAIAVVAVFDVGKTNKKVFLLDEDYKIVYERTSRFLETEDEDGDACENLAQLTAWCRNSFEQLRSLPQFLIRAVNFSAYGASFVHLDETGEPFLPLYNYLKPFPPDLKKLFFDAYGGERSVSMSTASPVLDNLNSGLQLYRLKYQKRLCEQSGYSLHLPQYLSYLITGNACSDITSIGCHTLLWDFSRHQYHQWVRQEGLDQRLAPIFPGDDTVAIAGSSGVRGGAGLHDSSAALIPYLSNFNLPFVLISTGTWCITLNPFNDAPLTSQELAMDCLCFLTYMGSPVKASRLFAGHEHEQQVKALARHFDKDIHYFENIAYNADTVNGLRSRFKQDDAAQLSQGTSVFAQRSLGDFIDYEEAYHQLIMDIMCRQALSAQLVMEPTTPKKMFVDGGFSHNSVYMNLLALSFPHMEVFAASVAQSTAIGAALAIHRHWNTREVPADLIALKRYSTAPA